MIVWVPLVAAALLGAIVGSFLNALLFRFNTGRSVVWGKGFERSRCMHCGHALAARDLVPIFSFMLLGGRCRYCGSRISWQYPAVEAAAAALGALTFYIHPEPVAFAFWFLVWMVVLFVVVYDIRHGIIPLQCSLLLLALSIGYLVLGRHTTTMELLAGPVLAAPLLLLSLVSRGRWMGWGDGTFELPLGWLLGLSQGATALMLAFWSGALIGIFLLALPRIIPKKTMLQFTMRSEVPFAPFLALGAFVAHVAHVDFFTSLAALF